MMRNIYTLLIGIISLALLSTSCEQSEAPESVRLGDSLTFSGYLWTIKHSESPLGPGPNPFSRGEDDVYVDGEGRLHLKIVQRNNVWYSTEVVSDEVMGYGTYKWTITGDMKNIASNAVLGLFTWDTENFETQANSEVDVEFAYWGNDSTEEATLQYSVQPVAFGPYYPERTNRPKINGDLLIGTTTHEFTWTKDLISWRSYKGTISDPGEEFASWSFDTNNPARIKYEGGAQSLPVVIPEPGEHTNARMNFWLASHIEAFPTNRMEHEVIIDAFEYVPL